MRDDAQLSGFSENDPTLPATVFVATAVLFVATIVEKARQYYVRKGVLKLAAQNRNPRATGEWPLLKPFRIPWPRVRARARGRGFRQS